MSDEPKAEARIVTLGPRRKPAPAARRPPAPEAPRPQGNPFVVGVLRQGYYNAVAYMNALTARQT